MRQLFREKACLRFLFIDVRLKIYRVKISEAEHFRKKYFGTTDHLWFSNHILENGKRILTIDIQTICFLLLYCTFYQKVNKICSNAEFELNFQILFFGLQSQFKRNFMGLIHFGKSCSFSLVSAVSM